MNTLIIQQGAGPECAEMLRLTALHHRTYATRHGMDLWTMTGRPKTDANIYWDKIQVIRNALALDSYQLVIWLDADTMICDPATDLRQAANEFEHIGVCRHESGWGQWLHLGWHLNAGAIYLRCTEATRRVFARIWDQRTEQQTDQSGMMAVWSEDPAPFRVIGNRWNAFAVCPCPDPAVLAWHGYQGDRPGEMARTLASLQPASQR